MPKVEADFECLECGDNFTATSGLMTKCKCGMCEVEPREYSTSYIDKGKGCCFKRLDSRTYYFEEEYHILDEEELELWNRIEGFKFSEKQYDTEYPSLYTGKAKDTGYDGKTFVDQIHAKMYDVNDSNEINEVGFRIRLNDVRDGKKDAIINKLKRFLILLEKVKTKEMDINNRDQMDEFCSGWDRKQQEQYDYYFYI